MDKGTVRRGPGAHALVTGSAAGDTGNALPVASYFGKVTDCLEIASRFSAAGIRFDLSYNGQQAWITTTFVEVLEAVRKQFKL